MIIVLDIETRELIPENRDLSGLRISIAGVRTQDQTHFFTEEELGQLFTMLDGAERIVGHNLLLFDYKVLQQYAQFDVCERYRTKTFDLFSILLQLTDRRISLNDLAQRNLGIAKAGSGSDAPRLFQEGRYDELKAYLEQDLIITQQLFSHVQRHGCLKYGHINYRDAVERVIAIPLPVPAPNK